MADIKMTMFAGTVALKSTKQGIIFLDNTEFSANSRNIVSTGVVSIF